MTIRLFLIVALSLLYWHPNTVSAKTDPKSDFDFVLGHWQESTSERIPSGGYKKGQANITAFKTKAGYGVEEDWSTLDPESSQASYWGTTFRVYDASEHTWVSWWFNAEEPSISSRFILSKQGDRITGIDKGHHKDFGDYLFRVTYFDISSNSYHYQLDWSFDQGQTWIEAIWSYSATRIE